MAILRLIAARCYAKSRPMPSCGVCPSVRPSVRPSVCLLRSCIVIKRFISPSGSHTVLVFPYKTLQQYFDGVPLTGEKSRFSTFGIDDECRQQFRPWSKFITRSVGLRLQRQTVTPKRHASVNLHESSKLMTASVDVVLGRRERNRI